MSGTANRAQIDRRATPEDIGSRLRRPKSERLRGRAWNCSVLPSNQVGVSNRAVTGENIDDGPLRRSLTTALLRARERVAVLPPSLITQRDAPKYPLALPA